MLSFIMVHPICNEESGRLDLVQTIVRFIGCSYYNAGVVLKYL